jgi:hypothetical protein
VISANTASAENTTSTAYIQGADHKNPAKEYEKFSKFYPAHLNIASGTMNSSLLSCSTSKLRTKPIWSPVTPAHTCDMLSTCTVATRTAQTIRTAHSKRGIHTEMQIEQSKFPQVQSGTLGTVLT